MTTITTTNSRLAKRFSAGCDEVILKAHLCASNDELRCKMC